VDAPQLQLVIFLLASGILILIMLFASLRMRHRNMHIRAELGRQREDSLRSISLMLQQMDYDAEVLRLLRHARNTRDAGRMEEFSGAIDTLIKKEYEMMERVDRVRDFEEHLKKTYGQKNPLFAVKKANNEGSTPQQIKEDIRTFVATLQKIHGGEPRLLEDKIAFFEKWVEGPQRQAIYASLKAMALFLEKGDPSGLEELGRKGKGG
jgi:hypothetical protein